MSNLLAARHRQRSSGSKLRLTVRQLTVEVIELGPSPGDFAAAFLDLDDQLRLHVVAPAIYTEAGETTRLRELDAQSTQGHDHPQAAQVVIRVGPVPVLGARRFRKHPFRLVEPDGRRRDAGAFRKLRDSHGLTLDLPVARRSRAELQHSSGPQLRQETSVSA